MTKKIMMKVFLLLLAVVGTCQAAWCNKSSVCPVMSATKSPGVNPVKAILKQQNQSIEKLESYQCRIEYTFSQPLLESVSLRKGNLYYQRTNDASALRINFETLKQDDEQSQEYIEQYVFDGVWLTVIDYQLKQAKRYQRTELNRPIDAFELARRNFPIVGFDKADDLEKEYEVTLIEPADGKTEDFFRLNLKVKPDSIYKDDYVSVELWIDKKTGVPIKIVAVSTEEDIYEMKLIDAKVNEKIDNGIFKLKIPKEFDEEIIPLKKNKK